MESQKNYSHFRKKRVRYTWKLLPMLKQILLTALDLYQNLLWIYFLIRIFLGRMPANRFGDFLEDLISPVIKLVQKIPHRAGIFDLSLLYTFILLSIIEQLVFYYL
mgnify:CR=1 FL=1